MNKLTIYRLTQSDKILVALYHATNGTTEKLPYEEIALQAWRDFPESFSLRNHPEYPDTDDVHKRLYTTLKTKGLVKPIGNKVFRLTDKGLYEAKKVIDALNPKEGDDKEKNFRLTRSEESYINYILKLPLYQFWKEGKQDKLIEYDVKIFFQFSTGTKVSDRVNKKIFSLETLQKANKLGFKESYELIKLAKYLSTQFEYLFKEEKVND